MTSHSVVDQKLRVLYDKYQDHDFAASAMKEVEDIRRTALFTGALISGAVFVGNEAVRLTKRSRMIFLHILITYSYSIVQVEASQHSILVGGTYPCR